MSETIKEIIGGIFFCLFMLGLIGTISISDAIDQTIIEMRGN